MKRKPHAVGVATPEEVRVRLPDEVQLRLGEIADVAKEGLLALASAAGLAVLHECMEHEVDEVVGPRAATTPAGRPSATATRPRRSRSAAGACRSAARS